MAQRLIVAVWVECFNIFEVVMEVKDIKEDAQQVQREKRAKAMVAMGLVDREGDHFSVTTPSIRGRRKTFDVRRNENGQVVCNCPEFTEAGTGNGFRCEHIIAVKYALTAQNSEPAARQPEAAEAALPKATDVLHPENETESRGSERGEQQTTTVSTHESADGQAGYELVETVSLEDTQGDKTVKQNNLREVTVEQTEETAEGAENSNNVLDFSATLKELRRHVDPKLVKQREGWRDRNGNVQMVDYVEWHTVADILDDAAPNWSHTVKDIRQIGELMTVTVAITIDGVTREGIGTGNANNEMGIKKAEHDALKRAAVKFGIARDLYRKESDVIERGGAAQAEDDGFPTEPVARSLGELVTAKQLGMIKAIARELGVDPNEECQSVMHCNTDELSKKAASALIQHLQDMQRQTDAPAQVPFRRAS
jgi:predicted nucleic acid-binding Zn finger protein